MHLQIIGVGRERGTIRRDRFPRVAGLSERVPKIIVRVEIAGIDGQRPTIIRDTRVDFPGFEKEQAAVVVRDIVFAGER